MPKPIICIADPLLKYAEQLRPCFSTRQYRYFVTVLLAMVECLERHTLSAFKRSVAANISIAGLSRFFNKYQWSASALAQCWWRARQPGLEQAVRDEHQRLASLRPKQVGRPKATVVTGYLIIDDSLHQKPQAHKMAGLGEHYSSTAQRVERGHSMFASLYWLLGQRVPLAPQLYRQKPVAEAEGVEFQSKVQMAVAAVEHFTPIADTQTEVLADSWYVNSQLYQAVRKRGWQLSGGLKSNRKMQVSTATGQRQWRTLAEYAASLPQTAWEQQHWGGKQDGRALYVHRVVSKVRKLGSMVVLITKPQRDSPVSHYRYFGSTRREADSANLLATLAQRWDTSVLFEAAKDLLGSDEYQLMSSQAVVRHWTMVFCVLNLLEAQRVAHIARQKEGEAPPTWGEMRAELQREHRRKLLLWLRDQFMAGVDVTELQQQLAA